MCQSPKVLQGDKLSLLSRGHVRWWALAQDAGPCAAPALRQMQLHPAGSALTCPPLAHHRKELTTSVMLVVVPVCRGHPLWHIEGVPVP